MYEIDLIRASQADRLVEPIYLGVKEFGTFQENESALPLPLRPWRSDADTYYSIIDTDTGTSDNITFIADGNRITISTEEFDTKLIRPGDAINVTGTTNNNGNFTISTVEGKDEITVDESITDESPTGVTIRALGDIPHQSGTNLDNYSFGDSQAEPVYNLRWHHFIDNINGQPKQIFICDRVLLVICSWNHINGSDFIFGKNVTIDGITFLCRSLTGGWGDRDWHNDGRYRGGALPNEWDRYVMNGVDQEGGPFFTGAPEPHNDDYLDGDQRGNNSARRREHNQAWNWLDMYTWCQEEIVFDASRRASRGSRSARGWYRYIASFTYAYIGFRPALLL